MAHRAESIAQSPAGLRRVAARNGGVATWARALVRGLVALAAAGVVLLWIAVMSYILLELAAWWVEIPNAYQIHSTGWTRSGWP
jgi:hypothetical protein